MLTRTKIRLFLWLVLLLVVVFLLWQAIVPTGHITYVYDLVRPNIFISELKPVERTAVPKDGEQLILGEPVYFDLYTPRHFDRAQVSLTWQNTAQVPVIELGLLQDKTAWRFITKPVQNLVLDQLLADWSKMRQGQTWFLQREPHYDSLELFWQQPPSMQSIAVYNYQPPKKFTLPNYQAHSKQQVFDYQLRGPYQFYTYIDNEVLSIDWLFKDLNLADSLDGVEVLVYDIYNNPVVNLSDDLVVSGDGLSSAMRRLSLRRSSLPSGFYKIEFKASQDIVTMEIRTTQQYLSFINQLQLFSPEQKNIILYTDSPVIRAQTNQAEGLQDISVNGQVLQLARSHEQVSLVNLDSINTIKLVNGGLMLSGKGVFSAQRNLLNPNLQQVDSYFKLSDDIHYVIANYDQPQTENGWQTTTIDFDLAGAELLDGKYRFLLSLPGLLAEDHKNDYVKLKEIKIELQGKTLWEKLQSKK